MQRQASDPGVPDAVDEALPCTEGVVTGVLCNIKAKTKDGLIQCRAATEAHGSKVFIYRGLLEACGASVGDRLAFGIHVSDAGQPQASAPVWKQVGQQPSASSQAPVEAPFPPYVGVVERVASSGACGSISSPTVEKEHGHDVYLQKSLLATGELAVGDIVAFDIHVNSKGHPQAVHPLFKMCSSLLPPPAQRSPLVGPQRSPMLGAQKSPPLVAQKSPMLGAQRSPMLGAQRSPMLAAQRSPAMSSQRSPVLGPLGEPPPIRIPVSDVGEASWAEVPSDFLLQVLLSAGPMEVCRIPTVCHIWNEVVSEAEIELSDYWKSLCATQFPAMTAKIVATELGDEADDLPQRRDSAMSSTSFQSGDGSVTGKFRPPSRASGSTSVPGSADFWRDKFVQRTRRQMTWEADKLAQQRQKQERIEQLSQQALVEDKQRGQNFRGQDHDKKAPKTLRAVRQKTCRRCAEAYLPAANEPDSCRWHRGSYLRIDEHGVLEASGPQTNFVSDQRVQHALRAIKRKKKSKQPHMVLPGAVRAIGDETWAWTCCGAESMIAVGCVSGPHT